MKPGSTSVASRDDSSASIRMLIAAFRAALIVLGLSLAGAQAPAAAQTAVDLQLVLAVDASGSVERAALRAAEAGLRGGLPQSAPAARDALRRRTQAIAVTMVQWTGPALQVAGRALDAGQRRGLDAGASPTAIEAAPRQLFGGGTSISGAIDHAMTLFPQVRLRGRAARDRHLRRRPQQSRPPGGGGARRGRAGRRDHQRPADPRPRARPRPYYRDNVIGGPGAFVIAADSFETFAEAILKKLVIEISDVGTPT